MIPYETDSYSLREKMFRDPVWLGLGVLGLLIVALVLLLTVMVLLLPPISLITRLDPAFVTVDGTGGDVQDPDGMAISFPAEGVTAPFRVKLSSTPRNLFLEGAASSALLTAAQSIPPNLIIKSPFYEMRFTGDGPQKVILNVPIPNESEPSRTLDLYSWTGESWQWLPSRQIPGEELLISELPYLPKSVVVVQTQAATPRLSTPFFGGDTLPPGLRDANLELNLQGLYLEADGLIAGQASPLPPEVQNAVVTVVPTIRNWGEDEIIRSDLIDNLLISEEARQRHIGVVVNLVESSGYAGIDLDYRGINPELRLFYTAFLEELRAALPAGKQLSVHVAPPQPISAESWDTGAYDWTAINELADVIVLPALIDPAAYAPGGQMETMLDWAVGQVSRYKLQLYLPTRSLELIGEQSRSLTYPQALEFLGTVGVVGGATTSAPGQLLQFTLSGLPAAGGGIQFDPVSGLYILSFTENNSPRTLYLENAASLARKLQFVAQYNLRGVAVQDLLSPNADPHSREVMRQFNSLFIPPVEGNHILVWRVANQEGGLIAEEIVNLTTPIFQWPAPAAGGTYQVIGALSPNRDPSAATPLGSVQVTVAP